MHTLLDCIPCFIRQALDVLRLSTQDPEVHQEILRHVLHHVSRADLNQSPPLLCKNLLELITMYTGEEDPYCEQKQISNQIVLAMVDDLKRCIHQSPDPLETAVRLAIAGNVIDFGIYRRVSADDIKASINHCLTATMDRAPLEQLREAVETANDILYLADNTGEIVMDRLLIETLNHSRLTLVVRGGPVLNDATTADAKAVGLPPDVEVINNGSRAPGTVLEDCSLAFRERFRQADLIIAKGQGNFETLHEQKKNIFYLLKVKCPIVSDCLRCHVGDMMLTHSRTHLNALSSR